MPSSWHLFWKPRARRNSDQPPPPDPPDSGHRRPRPRHGHGDVARIRYRDESHHHALPRSHSGNLHSRSFCHRAAPPELESFRFDHRSGIDAETSNRINPEVALRLTSRLSLIGSTQLPEPVLQARERLVERLRGVSLSVTRETTNDYFLDSGDENQQDWFSSNPEYLVFTDEESKRNPSVGVDWDTLCTLHLDVFKRSKETVDCCICLESFADGDGLIRLDCGHKFHPLCLEPWVKNCRYCPYCRANITC